MDSINLKKFLAGTGWVTPLPANLARLTFTNNSTSYVVDSDYNVIISDLEARDGIPSGQSYSTVKQIDILPECVGVGLQAFRNYSVYNWNPINGVNFTSATSIVTIDNNAFANWTNAKMSTDLVIPSTVINVGDTSFQSWTSNTKGVNLAGATALTYIGDYAFDRWVSTSACLVAIPSNVKIIDVGAFNSWSANTSGVNLAGATSLSDIGSNAFNQWKLAKMSSDLVIPSNVKIIDNNAFYGWEANTKGVNLTNATSLSAIGSNSFSYWNYASMASDLVIPSNVKTIGDNAFITWGNNPTGVNFAGATALTSIGNKTFYGWGTSASLVTIPSNVKTIGNEAFFSWSVNTSGVNLTNATSLTTIGERSFMQWLKAKMSTDLVIPSNVKTIGYSAFDEWWENPKGVILTNAPLLTAIEGATFDEWLKADMTTNLVIPSNIVRIEYSAFRRWEAMTSIVTFNEGLQYIGTTDSSKVDNTNPLSSFARWKSADSATNLVIPSTVKLIGGFSFESWNNMSKGVTFSGTSLTRIGISAFYGWFKASMTQNINIPSSVVFIGDNAFSAWYKMAFGMTFNSINPPEFGTSVFSSWGANTVNQGVRLTVPGGANLSTWKTALGGPTNPNFVYSINGILYASIP